MTQDRQKKVLCTQYSDLCNTGSSERHNDSHHVNGQLKLKELGDTVIDVPPPHHCLHNAAEVIICQDNV